MDYLCQWISSSFGMMTKRTGRRCVGARCAGCACAGAAGACRRAARRALLASVGEGAAARTPNPTSSHSNLNRRQPTSRRPWRKKSFWTLSSDSAHDALHGTEQEQLFGGNLVGCGRDKTTFQGKVDDEEDDRDNSDSRGKPNHELKSLVFQGAFLFWRCLTAGQRPPDTALERATLLQHSRTLVLKGERIWMRRRKGALRNHHRSRSTFRRCSWSTRFLLPFPLLTHTITTTTPSKSVKDRLSPP
jgi:hypothetical protein